MKIPFLLTIYILVIVAKMLRPGGIKSIIAENLLLKHQLSILGRSRQKASNLKTTDRFILGGLSLFISARRRLSVTVIIQPSTLLTFHRALVKRKYSRLFSNKGHRRPVPKGPSRELIAAIVELKQRNPRYGCPRIATSLRSLSGSKSTKISLGVFLPNTTNLDQALHKVSHGYRYSVIAKTVFGALICFAVNP